MGILTSVSRLTLTNNDTVKENELKLHQNLDYQKTSSKFTSKNKLTLEESDEDLGERNLMPRAIKDDEIIKKHQKKKLLNLEKEKSLEDEDLNQSIWDEESLLKNDIEEKNELSITQKKNLKIFNFKENKSSSDKNKNDKKTTTFKENNKNQNSENRKLKTSENDHVDSQPHTEVNNNDPPKRLTLFDDYSIKKRYTLNPEEDFSQEEIIEMPKQPKHELIVGILTLPISSVLKRKIRENIKSKVPDSDFSTYSSVLDEMTFYASSYAKWLEHNGVKTIPISINTDISLIYDMIDNLDGLLLTGGATPLFLRNNLIQIDNKGIGSFTKIKHPSDYLTIVNKIITYAKKKIWPNHSQFGEHV